LCFDRPEGCRVLDILLLAQSALPDTVSDLTSASRQHLKIWAYAGFIGLVLLFLALDLGVFHREAHEVKMKEAVTWSVIWLTCGLTFSAFIYYAYQQHWLGLGLNTPIHNPATELDPTAPLIISGVVDGQTAALQYLTGYIVEKSLAMDNIFVIALIFSFFAVPGKYQHRVLFWGIIGALVMRGGMIFLGGELILRYQWILVIFGAFLVLTALKMALIKGNDDPSQNLAVKLVKKLLPVAEFYDGQRFFTRRTVKPTYSLNPATGREEMAPPPPGTLSAKHAVTPLFLALVLVEVTDLVFAVDSIPAIFAITPDPFIVFTSNIFAILGLRALYFCLAALIQKFRFLKPALILILAFVGVKLLLMSLPPSLGLVGLEARPAIKITPLASLGVVVGVLAVATVASILLPGRPKADRA
jgi:tellurite resistance protein TerC